MEESKQVSGYEADSKNREIFTSVDTKFGIPTNLVVGGFVASVLLYLMFKSFFLTLIFAVPYFSAMYKIHEDDVHGLRVWRDCLSDKTVKWEAGSCKKIDLIITNKKES